MIYLDNLFITNEHQKMLFENLKELLNEITFRLDKLLINVQYKWIEDINIIDCYTNIYKFLVHNLSICINKINYYLVTNVKEYTKEKVYDYVIIKCICVYFLNKLFNLLVPFSKNNKIIEDLIDQNNKVLVEFKNRLYNVFNIILNKFINCNINNKETNLQIHKLHDECKSLFWLFNTCCNKPETLDVYTFLV